MKQKLLALFITIVLILSCAPLQLLAAPPTLTGNEWTRSPDTFLINARPNHASYMPHGSEAEALSYDRTTEAFVQTTPYYKTLNGEWKFNLVFKPDDVTNNVNGIKDFYAVGHDDTVGTNKWTTITVPSSWQVDPKEKGVSQYGDHPIYTNSQFPWRAKDSVSPTTAAAPVNYNPVGHYRRTFDVPADWDGRQILLAFEGVESAYYVWVNGQFVGYGEDNYSGTEFDLSEYVTAGSTGNEIAVRVYRWSDGSYMSDQDCIRYSGIFRDTYLYSVPKVHIRDFKVETNFTNHDYSQSELNVRLHVEDFNKGTPTGYKVSAKLVDNATKAVVFDDANIDVSGFVVNPAVNTLVVNETGNTEAIVTLKKSVEAPKLWSAEKPNQYVLILTLKDGDTVKEILSTKVGFREFMIDTAAKTMKINNKKVIFKGVNRHENDPMAGRAMPLSTMIKDMDLLKLYNVNAVRTSHYPSSPLWYELCDKYGMYVMDENNLESHDVWSTLPTSRAEWKANCEYRMTNMMQRDKNHASVVMWSLGNEAGTGSNFIAMRDRARLIDNRPLHYEGDYALGNNSSSDVYSRMYPGPWDVETYARNSANYRPYVLCEYAHAMGNSVGNLDEYIATFENYEIVNGGFIWEWADHSLWTKIKDADPNAAIVIKDNKSPEITATLSKGAVMQDGVLKEGQATHQSVSALNDIGGNFTLEAKFKPKNVATNQNRNPLILKSDSSYGLQYLRTGNGNTATIEFFIKDRANTGWFTTSYTLSAAEVTSLDWYNKFHVLTGIHNNEKGYVHIFLDGKELGKDMGTIANSSGLSAVNTPRVMAGYPLTVGYDAENTDRIAAAEFDFVRVYNRALSDEEALSTTRTKSDPNALIWQDFDDANIANPNEVDYLRDGYYLAYGGDWGDVPNDGNFCTDGLITADRKARAPMNEVKYQYQNIKVVKTSDVLNGNVDIKNWNLFTNVNEYKGTWELKQDGKKIQSGTFDAADLNIEPLQTKTVHIPFVKPAILEPGAEYWLNFSFTTKEDTLWSNAGHEVAKWQVAVPFGSSKAPAVDLETLKNLNNTETAEEIVVSSDEMNIVINKKTGLITDYTVDGVALFANNEGPRPNFARMSIDNDRGSTLVNAINYYRNVGKNMNVTDTKVERIGSGVIRISISGIFPTANNSTYSLVYTICGNGDVKIGTSFVSKNGNYIPEVGMVMTLPTQFENLTWYGRGGPGGMQESYIDRYKGNPIDEYKSTVSAQYTEYAKNSEMGNKIDVRWAALTDDQGRGLMAIGAPTVEVNAQHNTIDDLMAFDHPHRIKPNDEVTLRVNYKQMGVGGDTSWGSLPHSQYLINGNQTYSYSYTLRPLLPETRDWMTLSKRVVEFPSLKGINVNGKALSGFNKDVYAYSVNYMISDGLPEVEAIAEDGIETSVRYERINDFTVKAILTVGSTVNIEYSVLLTTSTAGTYLTDYTYYAGAGAWGNPSRPHVDASIEDLPLVVLIDGVQTQFDRGLGFHAAGYAEYNIEGLGFSRFQTYAGVAVNDSGMSGNNPRLEFVIKADFGDGIWKEIAKSGVITKTTDAAYFDVDILGAVRLRLEGNIASGGAAGGSHANFADSKFVSLKDNSGLLADITAAEALVNAPGYPENAVSTYQNAINAAKAVAGNSEATQEEIVISRVDLAFAKRVFRASKLPVDKTELQSLYLLVKDYAEIDYVADSWAAFAQALSNAEGILLSTEAIQEDVDAMCETLQSAVEDLIPLVAATGVSLNRTELSLFTRASEALMATIAPENATNQGVAWSSSDESIAIVSDSGVVTGKAGGTAVITATTDDGEFTAQCAVTVIWKPDYIVKTGETVSLPITLKDCVNFAGLQSGKVEYDGELLQLESITATKDFVLASQGSTFVVVSSGGTGHNGNVIIGYAIFTAKADLPDDVYTTVNFPTEQAKAYDTEGNVIEISPSDILLQITGLPPLSGDVNMDGIVDLADAILVMQYVSGNTPLTSRQLKAADVSKDGIVNVGDVIIIMQMCL